MAHPRIVKISLRLLGGVALLGLVGFLALGGMSLYKEWTKSPEKRIAEENTVREMQAEADKLAETGIFDNGIQIDLGEGVPQLGEGIPNLDGIESPISDNDSEAVQIPVMPREKSIVVNAEGVAQFEGVSLSEQDLAEYFMIWPAGTSVLLSIDPLCDEQKKSRWIHFCNEAGMSPRVALDEGEPIR